jgi:hypothetical protein
MPFPGIAVRQAGSPSRHKGGCLMKMKMLLAALLTTTLAGAPALAADGDDYTFKLVNKSSVDAIQFYTKLQNGKWSNDWLSTPVKPGASRQMTFKGGDTRCEVQTRVVFSDQSEFDTPVDYCKIDNVVVTDKELFTQ